MRRSWRAVGSAGRSRQPATASSSSVDRLAEACARDRKADGQPGLFPILSDQPMTPPVVADLRELRPPFPASRVLLLAWLMAIVVGRAVVLGRRELEGSCERSRPQPSTSDINWTLIYDPTLTLGSA